MLKTIEKVLLLQELEIFHFASTEHAANLASISREHRYRTGDVIFEKDSETDLLFLLVKGEAEIHQSGEPARTVRKAALNLWSFFSKSPLSADVKAASSCLILSAPWSELEDLLIAEPEFCLAVLQHMARLGVLEGRNFTKKAPAPKETASAGTSK